MNSKGFSTLLVILVILGLFTLTGAYLLYISKNVKTDYVVPDKSTQPGNSAIDKSDSEKNTGISLFGNLLQNMDDGQDIINCQSDFKCLIEASTSCTKAKGTYKNTLDIFGVKETVTSLYEIKGVESDKCLFYLQTQKIDLEFPESVSNDIIAQQEELYKKLEGKDGQCEFVTKDLTILLTNWSQGNYDAGSTSCKLTPNGNVCTTVGGDFGNASCSGNYFDKSL